MKYSLDWITAALAVTKPGRGREKTKDILVDKNFKHILAVRPSLNVTVSRYYQLFNGYE